MLYDIVFLPRKKTMVKPVTYHVAASNNSKAVKIAMNTLKKEHNIKYYSCDKIIIKETRVLK